MTPIDDIAAIKEISSFALLVYLVFKLLDIRDDIRELNSRLETMLELFDRYERRESYKRDNRGE